MNHLFSGVHIHMISFRLVILFSLSLAISLRARVGLTRNHIDTPRSGRVSIRRSSQICQGRFSNLVSCKPVHNHSPLLGILSSVRVDLVDRYQWRTCICACARAWLSGGDLTGNMLLSQFPNDLFKFCDSFLESVTLGYCRVAPRSSASFVQRQVENAYRSRISSIS
jgi:hypothetical protein